MAIRLTESQLRRIIRSEVRRLTEGASNELEFDTKEDALNFINSTEARVGGWAGYTGADIEEFEDFEDLDDSGMPKIKYRISRAPEGADMGGGVGAARGAAFGALAQHRGRLVGPRGRY